MIDTPLLDYFAVGVNCWYPLPHIHGQAHIINVRWVDGASWELAGIAQVSYQTSAHLKSLLIPLMYLHIYDEFDECLRPS